MDATLFRAVVLMSMLVLAIAQADINPSYTNAEITTLSHFNAKLMNAKLPCHKLLMPSQEFIYKRLLVSLVKKTKVFPKAQLPFRNTLGV
ncbi:unnamed protein product [Prunus armeniaca]